MKLVRSTRLVPALTSGAGRRGGCVFTLVILTDTEYGYRPPPFYSRTLNRQGRIK